MSRVRVGKRERKRVRIGAPDPSLTAMSGVAALGELVDRLGVVDLLDAQIVGFKQRDRGVSAGQLLVGLAQCQLLGGDALVDLDRQRADPALALLSAVPGVPATTAGALARRLGPAARAAVEVGNAALLERTVALLPPARRGVLSASAPTIDMDSTEVEVYGHGKAPMAYNYCGQWAGRPHLATWAQAGWTLAADLLAGNDDVRPRAGDLLRRALGALPASARAELHTDRRPVVRADAGYFTAELALAAVEAGCDFAIAAKRNTAMWRAYRAIRAEDWTCADGMLGAQVAACDYAPAGWPPDSYTLVRKVRIDAADISADGRSRRRRTMDRDQLALALSGEADCAYAVSFIVTNLPTGDPAELVAVERWFRRRTDIEDRIREAKLGAGLRHLPSANANANAAWMWGALLAGNLSVALQAITGIDTDGRGQAHAARLRHELLRVPARLIRHARGLTLRLPPGPQLLPEVLSRLRTLPLPA